MSNIKALKEKIASFCETDINNTLPDGRRIFERPLVGVASASDPIFEGFCEEEIIGAAFKPPACWLPDAVSVISYFLPFQAHIRSSNYGNPSPSLEWLHSRFLGESFNCKLRQFIVDEIEAAGGKAVAPLLHQSYFSDYNIFSSNWSERHVAYAAGLGSFGLHRGLITESGVAGRFGSVITNLKLETTPRPEGSHYQNCPFLVDGSCGVCISRCPAGAITECGKDKSKCYQYMFIEDHVKLQREQFGYAHSVCGKCQVDVPCEARIP
jgi:epoxyqueuosine reductase QueG